MVPCAREPAPPAVLIGNAGEDWVADVIAAGEDCRRTADGLQKHHKAPK